jgi:ATP-dependent DNA helicase RecG
MLHTTHFERSQAHALPFAPSYKPGKIPVIDHVTGEVTGEMKRLLSVVKREIKRRDIQAALGIRHKVYFRKAYLIPAINAGLIEMTIPDKPNSRLQKYRLTEKGRIALLN